MKTLNWYIARDLLINTSIAVAILTFVMVSGNLFRAFELVSKGVSPLVFGKFMLLIIPEMLRYTIPLSLLVGTVLLFSRLSADNEITAMKASGISLWQTISPALLFAAVLSAICFWLATSVAPHCRASADWLMKSEAIRNPLALIEPGRFINAIPNYSIRIGMRDGDTLGAVHILALDPETKELRSSITARRGRVVTDEKTRSLRLELEDATIANFKPTPEGGTVQSVDRVAMHTIRFPIEYGSKLDAKPVSQKLKFMDLPTILARINLDVENGEDVTPHYVSLYKRMSMALAPISFLLIGIPFAIRSRRSETSIGLLVSLLLGFGFYLFLVLTDSVKSQSNLHPEFLAWLPNVLYQGGGLWALGRIEKH
jgi:lipopolysaccharide export system permease protein